MVLITDVYSMSVYIYIYIYIYIYAYPNKDIFSFPMLLFALATAFFS